MKNLTKIMALALIASGAAGQLLGHINTLTNYTKKTTKDGKPDNTKERIWVNEYTLKSADPLLPKSMQHNKFWIDVAPNGGSVTFETKGYIQSFLRPADNGLYNVRTFRCTGFEDISGQGWQFQITDSSATENSGINTLAGWTPQGGCKK